MPSRCTWGRPGPLQSWGAHPPGSSGPSAPPAGTGVAANGAPWGARLIIQLCLEKKRRDSAAAGQDFL